MSNITYVRGKTNTLVILKQMTIVLEEGENMNKPKLSSSQIADVLLSLIGDIEPTGDSFIDHDRLCNLLKLQDVLDILLDEMYYICPYSENTEYSMKEAGNTAVSWFEEKQKWINGFLGEDDEHSN